MSSIYKKLSEIQKSVRSLEKDKKAYNYNYVSGDKLLSFIRPLMDEKGLLLMPEVTSIDTREMSYDAFQNSKVIRKSEVLYTLGFLMTWVDSESGETFTQKWASSGMNSFDKGFGSALTYGERYYLLKFFHIATDSDDVDAVSSDRDKQMDEAAQALAKSGQHIMQGKQQPKPRKKFTAEEYAKAVAAEANNVKNAAGYTMREIFLRTAPTPKELEKFDNDVIDMRIKLQRAPSDMLTTQKQ